MKKKAQEQLGRNDLSVDSEVLGQLLMLAEDAHTLEESEFPYEERRKDESNIRFKTGIPVEKLRDVQDVLLYSASDLFTPSGKTVSPYEHGLIDICSEVDAIRGLEIAKAADKEIIKFMQKNKE